MTPNEILKKASTLPLGAVIKIPCKSYSQMEALRVAFYRERARQHLYHLSVSRSTANGYSLTIYNGDKPTISTTNITDFTISTS